VPRRSERASDRSLKRLEIKKKHFSRLRRERQRGPAVDWPVRGHVVWSRIGQRPPRWDDKLDVLRAPADANNLGPPPPPLPQPQPQPGSGSDKMRINNHRE